VHRTLAAALTAAALLWAAAVLVAPLALAGHQPLPAMISAFIYQGAGLICHQRSERSFHVGGIQQPVCARCSGLYVSGAAGAAAAWIGWRRRPRVPRRMRAVLIVAAVPTAVTFALEFAGMAHPSNAVRALCALPLGAAGGWIFVRLLRADGERPLMRYDSSRAW
jgi:uncharacterized membrane protein